MTQHSRKPTIYTPAQSATAAGEYLRAPDQLAVIQRVAIPHLLVDLGGCRDQKAKNVPNCIKTQLYQELQPCYSPSNKNVSNFYCHKNKGQTGLCAGAENLAYIAPVLACLTSPKWSLTRCI
jgi:hypothetical protein